MQKQKEVSTIVGVIIIIVVSIIFFGAAVVYQNLQMERVISMFSSTVYLTASLLK